MSKIHREQLLLNSSSEKAKSGWQTSLLKI